MKASMRRNGYVMAGAKQILIIWLLWISACTQKEAPSEKHRLGRTEQAATVDLDGSYVVMGDQSVLISQEVTVHAGNIAVNQAGQTLEVGKDVNAVQGTKLVADRLHLEKKVKVSKVFYQSELLADPSAVIDETIQVTGAYFPVFPKLPATKAAVPGTDEQGNPDGSMVVLHHEQLCLEPGVYGSIRLDQHAVLRLAYDCDNPADTTQGSYELRDLEVGTASRVIMGPGSVVMRDLKLASQAELRFPGPMLKVRNYVGSQHSTLILGVGEAHFRNFLTEHTTVTSFEQPDTPIDIHIKDRFQLEHHNEFNAKLPDVEPVTSSPKLVRVHAGGMDGDCPFIYEQPLMVYPCTTDKAVKIGDHSEIRASILALDDAADAATIHIDDHSIAVGSYFADRIVVGFKVQLTHRDGLLDPGYTEGDLDNDGVGNELDNCPADPNPGQEDQDADLVGDACDNCPAIPNPKQERAFPDGDANDIGAACTDPPMAYCADGVVQPENAEECDDGFEQNGPDKPCGRLCHLNPPRITLQPQDTAVVQSTPAGFSLQAVGHYLQYQWVRDGQNIPGAYQAAYQIGQTELADNGAVFRCVVSNSAGSVISDPAILTVWECDETYQTQSTECGVGACYATGTTSCIEHVIVDDCTPGSPAPDDTQCDGIDNDCNGEVDEDYAPQSTSCGVGACAAVGVTACTSGLVTDSCTPGAPAPDDTQCDGIDNDCNGEVDEDYQPAGTACGVGTCFANGATSCLNGQIEDNCTPGIPAADDQTCDGLDDDCDDLTDEEYESRVTHCGTGACTATGTTSCVDGQIYDSCVPKAPGANDQTCDGVDDDCDGLVDEEYVSQSTTCGVGACAAGGSTACVEGTVTDSCAPGTPASDDATCDGTDDDCDNAYDEDYVTQATTCGVGACASTGVKICENGAEKDTCLPGEPGTDDTTCNQIDEDCNGVADDGYVAQTTTCGIGACASTGATSCVDGQVVDGCTPGTPASDDSNCNGVDDDCDGEIDEGCAPAILTHPQSVTVSQGKPITLTVVASGAGLTYQWQRFEQNIQDADGPSYSKTAVFSDNGAVYRCIVTNPGGTLVSNSATVEVIDDLPPDLELDGPDERTTQKDFVTITGMASDTGSGLQGVVVARDPAGTGAVGAVVSPHGMFSAEVPLEIGKNQLYVIAKDVAGNQAVRALVVGLTLSKLPRMVITEPVSASVVSQRKVDVKGYVRSSLPAEQIRLVLGERVGFPTGVNGEYQFAFGDVPLVVGLNRLVVRAETSVGSVSESVALTVRDEDYQVGEGPRIELNFSSSNVYLKDDLIRVSGTVKAPSGVESIYVNSQSVPFVGSGEVVGFSTQLSFSALGVDQTQIVVKAYANDATFNQVSLTVHYDPDAPELDVVGLQPEPEINNLTETPFELSGNLREANLAGLMVNNQSVPVTPGVGADNWSFKASLHLVRQETKTLQVLAWDLAGNHVQKKYLIKLDADLDIEIIKPKPGAEFVVVEPVLPLEIAVRIPGLAAGDRVVAAIDAGVDFELTLSGNTAVATSNILVDDKQHKITIKVLDEAQTVLAAQTTEFQVKNAANLPLSLVRQEPADQSQGNEANLPLVLYFNRPFDPDRLQVTVTETAHGMIYQAPEAADLSNLSKVELTRIERNNQPVPGGLSYVPGNRMVAFYGDRDFAYGGSVFVDIAYDQNGTLQPVARSSFGIRPQHTLLQGFVSDHQMNPLAGIVVRLPGFGYSTKTDREGAFYFGYGEPVEKTIPPGRHRMIVNPDRLMPNVGTVERNVYITAERINRTGMVLLPRLDTDEPYRRVSSGDANVLLAGGELSLDLSGATIYFPDGNSAGEVHVQKLTSAQLAYMAQPPFIPSFSYVVQPAGIEIHGDWKVAIKLPAIEGSWDYLEWLPKLALLMSLDKETLMLKPVGLGRVDKEQKTVVNTEPLRASRIDCLTFAIVRAGSQHHLEAYEKGEIGFEQMISLIASDQ